MSDLNLCQFIGRLGQDPEIRYMPNGEAVANFSIACSEKWKDKQGQQQERTTWVNLVAYRRLGEVIGEHLKKGSQVYVSGKLQTRKWQDQQGNDRYTTEVIVDRMQMLGGRSDNNQGYQQSGNGHTSKSSQNGQMPASEPDFDFDDSIPF